MRYLPLGDADRRVMFEKIGVKHIDDIFTDIPADKQLRDDLDVPLHQSELEVERELSRLAGENISAGSVPFFVGAGAYRHHVPASVDHLIQRSEFLTSYTPYQPEVTQGTLQYLFEFQTQVTMLTGMEVANASMYDGATSCAEAVLMAARVTRRKKIVRGEGGFYMNRSSMPADFEVPPHTHDHGELIVVLSGGCRLDDGTTELGPGDSIVIHAGTRYGFTCGDGGMDFLTIRTGEARVTLEE